MGSEAQADERAAPPRSRLEKPSLTTEAGRMRRAWLLVVAHPFLAVFIFALAVRLIVAIVLSKYFSGSLVLDDGTYWDMARDAATNNTSGWIPYTRYLYEATLAFTFPLSVVYRLFGPAEISGQIMVALLGSGAAVLVMLLVKEVLPLKMAVATGLVIALLPSQVLWSSLILKDASVWFVLAALGLLVARAGRADRKRLPFVACLILLDLIVLAYLRDHTLVVACWALMLSAWTGRKSLRNQRIAGAIALGITVPWLVGLGPAGASFVANAGSIDERRAVSAGGADSAIVPSGENEVTATLQKTKAQTEALDATKKEVTERVTALRARHGKTATQEKRRKEKIAQLEKEAATLDAQLADTAAEEQKAKEKLATIEGAKREPGMKHLVRGISVMLAEPYPWDAGDSPSFKMAQAETLVWYPILILALLGLLGALRAARVTLFPLLFGGGVMVLYALVEGNVGTAYRHRGEFVWVVALLAAFGVVKVGQMIEQKRSSSNRGATREAGGTA